jgi:hypothetical protein
MTNVTPDDFRRGLAKLEYEEKERKQFYPVAADRRCDAVAKGGDWEPRDWGRGPHRCGKSGASFRDGRWVCAAHRDQVLVGYTCGNHFTAFAEVMAQSLDEEA